MRSLSVIVCHVYLLGSHRSYTGFTVAGIIFCLGLGVSQLAIGEFKLTVAWVYSPRHSYSL